MKYVFLIVLFFSINLKTNSNTSTDNSDKLLKVIKTYLNKASHYQEIRKFYKLLSTTQKKYQVIKTYVPSFSPLNPNKQKRISSLFGKRFHPVDKKVKPHLGLDISANYGTPVHATATGFVKAVKFSNVGYGNQVEILHGFGFETRYAHLHKLIVKQGQRVNKGDVIGFVGSSGKSTASHLHYEIKKNRIHLDPYPFCFLETDY